MEMLYEKRERLNLEDLVPSLLVLRFRGVVHPLEARVQPHLHLRRVLDRRDRPVQHLAGMKGYGRKALASHRSRTPPPSPPARTHTHVPYVNARANGSTRDCRVGG